MKVNTIEVDFKKVCKYSNYFRSLDNFKEAGMKDLRINLECDTDVLRVFFNFLQMEIGDANLQQFVEYSYDITQLILFFGCDKEIQDYFKKLLDLFFAKLQCNMMHINSQIMISFYYLHKFTPTTFDLNKYIDVLFLDEQYFAIMHDVQSEMEQNDFFDLYDIWMKPMKNNDEMTAKYRLLSVFQFDLSFKKLQTSAQPSIVATLQHKEGDKHCVADIGEFRKKLTEFCSIDLSDDFNWNNVIIAGGCVLGCILQRKPLYGSDIDFWIYGLDRLAGIAKMREILRYLTDKIGAKAVYIMNRSIITLCFADYQRNIQIILTDKSSPMQVIENFDMDYIYCVYDGAEVLGTTQFMRALIHQTCLTNNSEIHPIRLMKAMLKGYAIMHAKDFKPEEVNVDKIINKYYYPTEKEFGDIARLKLMLNTFIKGRCYLVIDNIKFDEMTEFNIEDYTLSSNKYIVNNLKFGVDDLPSKKIKWNKTVLNNVKFNDFGVQRGDAGVFKRHDTRSYIRFTSALCLVTEIMKLIQLKVVNKYDAKTLVVFNLDKSYSRTAGYVSFMNDLDEKISTEIKRILSLIPHGDEFKLETYNPMFDALFYYAFGENTANLGITDKTLTDDVLKEECAVQFKINIRGMRLYRDSTNYIRVAPYYEIADYKFYELNKLHNSKYSIPPRRLAPAVEEEIDI